MSVVNDSLTRIPRNDAAAAMAVLRERHGLGRLRDQDFKVALKLQDDDRELNALLLSSGLDVNDPDDL